VNDVQQGLLTATEAKTHKMETRDGIKVDTQHVCWVLATTDRGALFDAFDTRFTKVNLRPYTAEEMAQIVFNQNPDVPLDACRLVAKYAGHVTREALAFVTEARTNREFNSTNWKTAIEATRVEMGIDEFGLDADRLTVLKTLGLRGPSSLGGLAQAIGKKEEELQKFVLPPLKEYRENQPALISVSHRHFITEGGLKELEKRGYKPDRKKVLPRNAA
jgi:Holliday junction resolvasome RuvABC ATP-dependent DNA helicase subunit